MGKGLKAKMTMLSVSHWFLYNVTVFVYIAGTHHLQNVKIHSITVDSFCLQFQYVNGSTITNTTYLQFVSMYYSYSILYEASVLRNDKLKFTDCITVLPPNNWTLYACDQSPCTINPAVTISDIIISENSPLSTSVQVENLSILSTDIVDKGCTDSIIYSTPWSATYTSIKYTSTLASTFDIIKSIDQSVVSIDRSVVSVVIFESNNCETQNVTILSGKY